MRDVFIVDGVRSPIGSFGGSLKDFVPSSLTATLIEAIFRRTGLDKELVDEVILGAGIPTEFSDWARTAALRAGLPEGAPALLVNFNCGSGMQAMIRAANSIMIGDTDVAVAGGAEIMSAAPYWVKSARWGQRLWHGEMTDSIMGSLKDAVAGLLMGESAEIVAEKFAVERDAMDELALLSHQRATEGIRQGKFVEEIEPIPVKAGKETRLFQTDECPRADATLEKLASLKPAFKEGGRVTAGNSSPLNDAASVVLLASEDAVAKHNMRPLARIVSNASAGLEPNMFGYAPVLASRKALDKAGLNIGDIDLAEINEAFAVVYLVCEKHLELDRQKTNVNGGAIAIGHPVGASGARLAMTLGYELRRRGLKRGLATMCVGGGMAVTLVIENVS